MGTPSDPRTLVMHGLRLKGFAEAAVAKLLEQTERYCVVYQTLREAPPVDVTLTR